MCWLAYTLWPMWSPIGYQTIVFTNTHTLPVRYYKAIQKNSLLICNYISMYRSLYFSRWLYTHLMLMLTTNARLNTVCSRESQFPRVSQVMLWRQEADCIRHLRIDLSMNSNKDPFHFIPRYNGFKMVHLHTDEYDV